MLSCPRLLHSGGGGAFSRRRRKPAMTEASSLLRRLTLPHLVGAVGGGGVREVVSVNYKRNNCLDEVDRGFPRTGLTNVRVGRRITSSTEAGYGNVPGVGVIATSIRRCSPRRRTSLVVIGGLLRCVRPRSHGRLLSHLGN